MKKNNYFSAIFIVTTVIFSYFGFNSYDIKIIGPEFFEIAYFEEELKIIEANPHTFFYLKQPHLLNNVDINHLNTFHLL